MLKQLIEQGLFEIYDEPMHWEDAIHASVAPLVKAGACTEQYAEVIIDRIKTLSEISLQPPHHFPCKILFPLMRADRSRHKLRIRRIR